MNSTNPINRRNPTNHPFRFDRFLTLYFFYPLLRIGSFHKKAQIPILMYHSISKDAEDGIHPYYRINTSPDVFTTHMKFLHENNYKVIGLDQATKMLKSAGTSFGANTNDSSLAFNQQNKHNKPRFAVITFDDGYHDFYTGAFPVLQNYDYRTTVFLPTGFIDNKNKLKGKCHLTWKEILELSNNGISFGSHTVTHPQLKFLQKKDIEFELRQSKEVIEDKLGKPAESFSYPYAFPEEDKEFTKYLRGVLQKYGYKHGASTRIGMTSKKDDIYFMKRIPVNSCDDLLLFKTKLNGTYDWLYYLQYMYKQLEYLNFVNKHKGI